MMKMMLSPGFLASHKIFKCIVFYDYRNGTPMPATLRNWNRDAGRCLDPNAVCDLVCETPLAENGDGFQLQFHGGTEQWRTGDNFDFFYFLFFLF